MKKWVYLFTEGSAGMREILGNKGADLAEMTKIGLPVPEGFTITADACAQYYRDSKEINADIQAQIYESVARLEESTGKKFNDSENPLLVAVRSGAKVSMPGLMETILNLGLNEEVVNTLAAKSENPKWAWDCYRRFIQMYAEAVMGIEKKCFDDLTEKLKTEKGVQTETDFAAEDLRVLAEQFKEEYKEKTGVDFPDDAKEQLIGAIKAVFSSWDNPETDAFRKDHNIPFFKGAAATVQEMVFGNMGDDCGTGVAYTRDPKTGEKGLCGEFLVNAQGEDVISGVRTPIKIVEMSEKFPEAFKEFAEVCRILEEHYKDMQNMEFTIEHEKLFMLQTRSGRRTPKAILKIACDLVDEGIRTEEEALMMITPRNIDEFLHMEENDEISSEAKEESADSQEETQCESSNADTVIVSDLERVLSWADKFRKLRIRTNTDSKEGAEISKKLGAEGIGLCRTEYMFSEGDSDAFKEMLCSDTAEKREAALSKIFPSQQKAFEEIFEAMDGDPVTVRFLDSTLGEICESNPMMGHRGCRLLVTYPEIAKMQTKAVIRAAIKINKDHPDWMFEPEIMIPFVSDKKELDFVKAIVVEAANAEIEAAGSEIDYKVGTMMELPRTCLVANEIAESSDFFSFGTNDLTQMTFGFSKNDADKFLGSYYDNKILTANPFVKLDQNGVGRLMDLAVKLGRPSNDNLEIGVCGEQSDDPSSIEFCHRIDLDYISCSPCKVPQARLAAALAAIKYKDEDKVKQTLKDIESTKKAVKAQAKETAETIQASAQAGFAGLKAGLKEARAAYKDARKKDNK